MGAFFLYRSVSDIQVNEAESIFSRKGFASPHRAVLGDWRLLTYRKILLKVVDNYVVDGGHSLFACGTVVYHGLSYRESLQRLLQDFKHNKVNQNELIGHFCLLYWNGDALSVLTDQLNTFHIFSNDAVNCLSSSFLAMLTASPTKRLLNRRAVCEKLSTGYIISPDTLVEGISQIDDELAQSFSQGEHCISFIKHALRPIIQLDNCGIEESLKKQEEVLKGQFEKMDALNSEYGGDLGISDGFDSRLVLACAEKFFSKPIMLHTHATGGVHDRSKELVSNMASSTHCALRSIQTTQMDNHLHERAEEILNDGLLFFDARSSHNMGAFSETYTRGYKEKVLDQQRCSLNGLGGEIYRNYYSVRRSGFLESRKFMNLYDYYTFAKDAFGNDELYEEMHLRRMEKISKRLKVDVVDEIDFLALRRYYSEVRMPDCDANNSDAQNTVSFYLMPFIQPAVTWAGIDATPYIGVGGSYQGALITRISPSLASFPSHYGYSFDRKIPAKISLKYRARETIPMSFFYSRSRRLGMVNKAIAIKRAEDLLKKIPILNEVKSALLDTQVISDFDSCLLHYAQKPTAFYVGTFLNEFSSKIKF